MTEADKKSRNKSRNALSMVALARRAGKIVSGEDSCHRAIRNGEALLVILASDCSDNTRKKFRDKTKFYNVPIIEHFTKDEITTHTGLQNRATIAVTDANFAAKIKDLTNVLDADSGQVI